MTRSNEHRLVARAALHLATWPIENERAKKPSPAFPKELLGQDYLREVDRGSIAFDVKTDVTGHEWILTGITTPAFDGARREDLFLASLVPWKELQGV